jgi:hypothetical protein
VAVQTEYLQVKSSADIPFACVTHHKLDLFARLHSNMLNLSWVIYQMDQNLRILGAGFNSKFPLFRPEIIFRVEATEIIKGCVFY